MPTTWSLRPLAESDGDILRAATLVNVNWTGEERFMAADVDARPDFRHYVELRPARGRLRGGGGVTGVRAAFIERGAGVRG
jgi:hypothetical protein